MKAKVIITSTALLAVFAFMLVPAVSAYSGSITCLTPASCASSETLSLSGPGSSATATFLLNAGTAPSGTNVFYYVCPQSASSCSSSSGTDNGWSWTFSPVSGVSAGSPTGGGVTGSGAGCSGTSCEGNGFGTPSTLSLTVTAPTTVTASNSVEDLTIYACSQSGSTQTCASILEDVASLTITSSVPEFGMGLGLSLVIGLFGLLFVVRRKGFALPSVSMA